MRALGTRRRARLLELGSGNGSNSIALARRSLALDACEGTERGTELTRRALVADEHAHAYRLILPGPLPRPRYDGVVIAELLYYLAPRQLAALSRDVAAAMGHGARLVLAHHHIEFHDTAQPAAGIHGRFLAAAGGHWQRRYRLRNRRWQVEAWTRTA